MKLVFNGPSLAIHKAACEACKHNRLRIGEGVEQAEDCPFFSFGKVDSKIAVVTPVSLNLGPISVV